MTQLDEPTVERAFERAANTAKYGSQEARSGQFGAMTVERQLATRLLNEAEAATRAWSSWMAINDCLSSPELERAISHLDLWGLGPIRQALMRDAILGAYRLSDPHNADNLKVSLCRAVKLSENADTANLLASTEWALDIGYGPAMAKAAAETNARKLGHLQDLVVSDWKKPPKSSEFLSLRMILKPIRDRQLAHSIDSSEVSKVTVDELTKFIGMTLDLAADFSFVMNGSAPSPNDVRKLHSESAKRFWELAFKAPLDQYRQYNAKG